MQKISIFLKYISICVYTSICINMFFEKHIMYAYIIVFAQRPCSLNLHVTNLEREEDERNSAGVCSWPDNSELLGRPINVQTRQ